MKYLVLLSGLSSFVPAVYAQQSNEASLESSFRSIIQSGEDLRAANLSTVIPPITIQHGLYAPYPVQTASSDTAGPYQSHNRRFYYASIIEVVEQITIYAISCGPVGTAASWSTIDVCGTEIIGTQNLTITEDSTMWKFSASLEAEAGPVTEVQCQIKDQPPRPCTFMGPEGTVTADGTNTPSSLFPEAFRHFTTMRSQPVYVTAGREKLQSQSGQSTTLASESTGVAPKVTGAIGKDVLFGAAGFVGAAVFGL